MHAFNKTHIASGSPDNEIRVSVFYAIIQFVNAGFQFCHYVWDHTKSQNLRCHGN